jgi:hypothetical protein
MLLFFVFANLSLVAMGRIHLDWGSFPLEIFYFKVHIK